MFGSGSKAKAKRHQRFILLSVLVFISSHIAIATFDTLLAYCMFPNILQP